MIAAFSTVAIIFLFLEVNHLAIGAALIFDLMAKI
jgi:hypothetical protein